MKFEKVRNVKDLGDGRFDCEVEHPKYGWIPYTAGAGDNEEHGKQLLADIKAGKFGAPAPFDPDSPMQKAIKAAELREQLDALDFQSIRALRAKLSGLGTKADDDKLAALETQAADLRAKLGKLK